METPTKTPTKKRSPIKGIALVLGSVIGIAHIGVLGHLLNQKPNFPVINFPAGDYSSYRVKADRDGYEIEFKANDPASLRSNKSRELDQDKKGFFGGSTTIRREYRSDEYTMDGTRNIGGAITEEGKSAKDIECIVADAGARSQGAMAGTAISAGLIVPAVSSIPYVGWLASGWALLLGQRVGSDIGSEVGSAFNDC